MENTPQTKEQRSFLDEKLMSVIGEDDPRLHIMYVGLNSILDKENCLNTVLKHFKDFTVYQVDGYENYKYVYTIKIEIFCQDLAFFTLRDELMKELNQQRILCV